MSKNERKEFADRIKMQTALSNYGLPTNAKAIGLGDLSIEEARQKIPAIRELWVRLDLWVMTGTSSCGSIAYPEAKRQIEYNFTSRVPKKSTIVLKSLTRSRHYYPRSRRHYF